MMRDIHIVQYGSKRIEYELSFVARKSLGIKVLPEGTVQVVAPTGSSVSDIHKKVQSKSKWILKQKTFFDRYNPRTPKRQFVNGETHLYLGRQYKLKIVQDKEDTVKIYRGVMILATKNTTPPYLEILLNDWYRSKAVALFNELVNSALEKFKQYKIPKPVLYVRHMQKRWGSCTQSGKIILNTELIKASKASIEYVVIHELCHLVYHNHTKAFYTLQNKLMPQWEKWKEQLERSLS
ncbi:MAG: SprT family zinc-dependent metalloprotease [Phycisphaerales bacterium]|nr:SprT family zinc-dependent metalloprotease [Phycisphaerales bacterium]